jgi:cytochrome c
LRFRSQYTPQPFLFEEITMKLWIQTALIASAVALSAPAMANQALAQKSGCLACHAVDKKVVGPAYQDVAKKYAGMKAEELAKRIKSGGSGHWGPVPMPPQPALSEADAKTLATWILGGAK